MTKTRKKYRTTRETWWFTYAQRGKHCQECRTFIEPETTYAYLPATHSVLCQECFKETGERAKLSERLRVLHGGSAWHPSADEQRLLDALDEGPLTQYELSVAANMPMGKVRGLLGHLKARRRVMRDNDKWNVT